MGMVHNRDDALELTQETFVKAYENLDRFKGESSFYTWLYRSWSIWASISAGATTPRHGRSADRPGGGEDLEANLPDQRLSDPYHQARSTSSAKRVQQAIDELTPDHKAVILLREVEGLSYDDISRVMQCSKGTVMSRLHYARKKAAGQAAGLLVRAAGVSAVASPLCHAPLSGRRSLHEAGADELPRDAPPAAAVLRRRARSPTDALGGAAQYALCGM
jgi:RNA polymerase sigma-70 factor (ECF subfamily)